MDITNDFFFVFSIISISLDELIIFFIPKIKSFILIGFAHAKLKVPFVEVFFLIKKSINLAISSVVVRLLKSL